METLSLDAGRGWLALMTTHERVHPLSSFHIVSPWDVAREQPRMTHDLLTHDGENTIREPYPSRQRTPWPQPPEKTTYIL